MKLDEAIRETYASAANEAPEPVNWTAIHQKAGRRRHLGATMAAVASILTIGSIAVASFFFSDARTIESASSTPDPETIDGLSGPGGALVRPMEVDEIESRSGLIAIAVVKDIHRPRLDTDDGNWPSVDVMADAPRVRTVTDVDLEFVAVLKADKGIAKRHGLTGIQLEELQSGAAATSSKDWATLPRGRDRAPVTITVSGGRVDLELTVEQAQAMGITAGEGQIVEPGDEIDEEGEITPLSDPDAKLVDHPVSAVYGRSPLLSMTEGDTILIMLQEERWPAEPHRSEQVYLTPSHPMGVWHQVRGNWRSGSTQGDLVSIDDLNLNK